MNPAHKKLLSYQKDGRNAFAESRGIAHKAIAKRKAQARRALRRAETVATAAQAGADADPVVARTGRRSWKKIPDAPLGKYVGARLASRVQSGMNPSAKQSGLLKMAKKRARYRPFGAKGNLPGMER